MNSQDRLSTGPVDVHGALARAHADRAEYLRSALGGVSVLLKRVAASLRRQPQAGAWA